MKINNHKAFSHDIIAKAIDQAVNAGAIDVISAGAARDMELL